MSNKKGEVITKDTKIPKYFRTKDGRVIVGTVTLYKNRLKLELETLSDITCEEIDKEINAGALSRASEVTDAKAEAKRIVGEAQAEVKAKSAQIATAAEIEAKRIVAEAKEQAATVMREAVEAAEAIAPVKAAKATKAK